MSSEPRASAPQAFDPDCGKTRPWDWRRASGGVVPGGDLSVFHAYDVNDNAACSIGCGLTASCEEPNEGSKFCRPCMEFVVALPEGRRRHERSIP